MEKDENILTGIIIDETWLVSLDELCKNHQINMDFVVEMINYGLLEPVGKKPKEWHFNANDLRRLQMAIRLHRDLEINLAGIGLILDLIEELESLRKKVKLSAANREVK